MIEIISCLFKIEKSIVEDSLSLRNALKIMNASGLEICFVTKNKLFDIITDGTLGEHELEYTLSDNIKRLNLKEIRICKRKI